MMIKKLTLFLLLFSCLFLSGCVGWISFVCDFTDNPHCYQWFAIQENDADTCDKMPQDKRFIDVGSNPPKDKCYLTVAENTGNSTICEDIVGGMYSYTQEECYQSTAIKHQNAELCKGAPNEISCRSSVAAITGSCGKGYEYKGGVCIFKGIDKECQDPTFLSKCASTSTLLKCKEGIKSIVTCEYGCFEAECRKESGDTDINAECSCFSYEECVNGKCIALPVNECKSDSGCAAGEFCYLGSCIEDINIDECKLDEDCGENEKCLSGVCTFEDAQCWFDEECAVDEVCEKTKCTKRTICSDKDAYCVSSMSLTYCEKSQLLTKECEFGCNANKCLSKEEAGNKNESVQKEKECKEGYNACVSEYTREFCLDGVKSEEHCEFGCQGSACRATEKKTCPWWNPFCKETDDDVPDKVKDDVKTIADAATGKYMELLEQEIENEKNPAKLRGLEKYKKFLEKAGDTIENVQTTVDALNDMKRIFVDSYDPSMDIENMPVDKLLKPGFFDRVGQSIFGGPKTEAGIEMAEAEDSLTVYEAMLKRQAEIDFLKQSRLDRLGQTLVDGAKEKATGELADKAKDIAEGVAGTAMTAVSVVDYALTSFQDEAKKQSFVGLARAYNRRRAVLEQQFPDLDDEGIHKLAVNQVQNDPYADAKAWTFIKFGNILENKDCQEGTGNQLCIDNRVWWTSMGKSYEYTHNKELHDRFIAQIDNKLGK
jgi:hypothetical protein